MSTNQQKCLHCGWPLGSGTRFCENCLEEIDAASEISDLETTASDENVSVSEDEQLTQPDTPPQPSPLPIPSNGSDVSPDTASGAHCPHLNVLYNACRVFVEGITVPFEFRVTPKFDDLSELCIEIRRSGHLAERYEPEWDLVKNHEMHIPIAFCAPAGIHGIEVFDIYIGYKIGNDQYWYLAKRKHKIFRTQDKAGSVIKEINIQFSNALTQGHAGDARINQQIGLDKVIQPDDPAKDFEHIDLPPRWEPLLLSKCHYKPAKSAANFHAVVQIPPPPEALCKRLTLRSSNLCLHLLADTEIQLGRNRRCDIVTRHPGNQHEVNRKISRYHCRIEMHNNHCVLIDKGWDSEKKTFRHSTSGTFIDNSRLSGEKSHEMVPDAHAGVSLGDSLANDPNIFAMDAHLWTCGRMETGMISCQGKYAPHDLACLTLHRRGDNAELFVLLWKCFSLSKFDSHFCNTCICRRDNAFLVQSNNRCEWLLAGTTLHLANNIVKVEEYNQALPE